MDKTYLRGECLEVDIVDIGLCSGTFYSQTKDKTKIVLFNVKCQDGIHIKGYTCYFTSEVTSIRRVAGELGVFILSQMEYDNLQLIGKKYIPIQKIDNKFNLAIDDLKKSSYIGVGTEGTKMGRKSELGMLTLTTSKQIYIFDIHILRDSAFTSGIRSLLENSSCMKIIHDSRNISDLLFHKYNVVLKHVFDTAVADVIIMKNKQNCFPEEIRTLEDCLFSYMGLSDIIENLDSTEYINDTESLHIQKVAAINNTYLHCLKDVMKNHMYASLDRGLAYYLDIERKSDDFETWTRKEDDKFPKDLVEIL